MATLNTKTFPDELYQQLQELADKENRFLSQEVISLLHICPSLDDEQSNEDKHKPCPI